LETENVETHQQTRNRQRQKELAKIEFENVTLRIPKRLMDFLRRTPGGYGSSPVAYLEYSVVDHIKADLEALSSEEIIEWSGLGPVFRAILNDERTMADASSNRAGH